MIPIADECAPDPLALAAMTTESWAAATAALLLLAALLIGLYLRERHLRRLDRALHMQRRDRVLGALNAITAISSRTFDLDEILKSTAHWTHELFAQHCDILLFDLESGQLAQCETSRENHDQKCEALRRVLEGGLGAYLVREHIEILSEDDLSQLPPEVQIGINGCSFQSFVAIVLYSHRKILGVLLLSSPDRNQFTASERNLAVAIARQLGNSVEKVLFYRETELAYRNLRSAQEQLLHSEKMSALGQLIAGVAHELNNPLTAILGYAQLLEAEPIGERAQDYVRKLYHQTQRTHCVVQNLLSFSRQRRPIQSQVDLRHVLQDTLAQREFDLRRNDIQVDIHCDPVLPFISGDAHQLVQVFLNIINNAVDSIMEAGSGGTLRIRLYPEDQRVCVEFRDSGIGIKDPAKVFDPFYTTKKIGKGSGLGLSICYGIVKEHGGDILAFNHEQGGAVLQLKLPVTGPQISPS